ncbi:helix-turn-helix domain-containing protein [Nocardiopsis coralliicola]
MNVPDSGAAPRAAYAEHRGPPDPRFACTWEQHAGTGAPYVQRVLPDGCADIVVGPGGTARIVGPTAAPALARLAPGERLHGLRLRPSAIGAALGLPAAELRDAVVPLDAVLAGPAAARLAEQVVSGSGSPPAMLPAMPGVPPDPRVVRVLHLLAAPGASVAGTSAALGWSERQLRRTVLAACGIEPRAWRRIARLHRFLERAEAGLSASAAAAAAGYADQAHLVRDVRRLSGVTPRTLLAERAGGRGAPQG